MESIERDREVCLSILKEYTKSESLLKHAYAVETCVKAYAKKFSEDELFWGNVVLLHDFDYEMFPTAAEHPFKGSKILNEKGFSEEFRKAILSHADYTNVPRETLLQKVLFACDELVGFITAVKNVSREDITKGAELMNIPLEEHIQFCINAMKENRAELGL